MDKRLDQRGAVEMNHRVADLLQSAEGMEKVAALVRDYTEDHIHETSFADKLKEPDKITDADCDRAVNHFDPIIIDEVDSGQWAMAIDFTGSTRNEVVKAPRYAFTINRIQTATVTYDTDRLRTVKQPFSKLLRRDLGEALSNAKDRGLVINVESAVQYVYKTYAGNTGNATNGLNASNLADGTVTEYGVYKSSAAKELVDPVTGDPLDNFVTQRLVKSDLTDFQNTFNGPEAELLVGNQLLVSDFDANRTSDWTIETVGDAQVASTVESTKGYKSLKNFQVVRTRKNQYVRPGNMYAFAPWENLGRYVQLDGLSSFSAKEGTKVRMYEWMYLGMGFAILNGLKKFELYSGSSIIGSGMQDTGYEVVVPKPDSFIPQNNKLDEGIYVPNFTQA